jgi:hypothetical protein
MKREELAAWAFGLVFWTLFCVLASAELVKLVMR